MLLNVRDLYRTNGLFQMRPKHPPGFRFMHIMCHRNNASNLIR